MLTGNYSIDVGILLQLNTRSLRALLVTNKDLAALSTNVIFWTQMVIGRYGPAAMYGKPPNLTVSRYYFFLRGSDNNFSRGRHLFLIVNNQGDVYRSDFRGPTFLPYLPPIRRVLGNRNYVVMLSYHGDVYVKEWDKVRSQETFTRIPNLSEIREISAGYWHTVALDYLGNCYVFGKGNDGQLGLGDRGVVRRPKKMCGLPPIQAIAAGGKHSVLIADNGDVYVCGANWTGQLGVRKHGNVCRPMRVQGIPPVQRAAAGSDHTILLTYDGKVYVSGCGYRGQLGLGRRIHRKVFTRIKGLPPIQNISAREDVTVLLDFLGRAYYFGTNTDVEFDLPNKICNTPFLIRDLPPLEQVHIGDLDVTLLTTHDEVYFSRRGSDINHKTNLEITRSNFRM